MHAEHADGTWTTASALRTKTGLPMLAANPHAGLRPIRVFSVHLR